MLLLGDDLQQDHARDVLLGLLVGHDEVHVVDHQPPDISQRDVTALHRVVETTVGIFLDDPWFAHR